MRRARELDRLRGDKNGGPLSHVEKGEKVLFRYLERFFSTPLVHQYLDFIIIFIKDEMGLVVRDKSK